MKIAHIAPDQKFIDNAADIFESVYPGQNTFFITTPKPWKFLKDERNYQNLTPFDILKGILTKNNIFKQFDVVILHSLPANYLLPLVFIKQKYIWIGWGFDYYSREFESDPASSLLLTKTRDMYHSNKNKNVNKSILKRLLGGKLIFHYAMKNLNVFSPVLPQEFNLVRDKYNLNKSVKYSPWNYGILERHLIKGIRTDGIETADCILLGNSATDTNNHVDALDVIIKSRTNRKIYIPLSYGEDSYAEFVKTYIKANEKIAGGCIILDSYMTIDEYNGIINDCGFVIMNHIRQQALGNIITMLYRGAKVFLRKESLVYKFFKEQGAVIYSVQELEDNPQLLEYHLSKNEIEKNRNILKLTWSESVIFERTKRLIEVALT